MAKGKNKMKKVNSIFFDDAVAPRHLAKVSVMLETCKKSGLRNSGFNHWIKGKCVNYTLVEERDCWSLQVSHAGMTDYYKIDDNKLVYDSSYKTDDDVPNYLSYDLPEIMYYKTGFQEIGLACIMKPNLSELELNDLLGITFQNNSDIKKTVQLTNVNNAYLKHISEIDNTTIKDSLNRIIEEDLLKRYDELNSINRDI